MAKENTSGSGLGVGDFIAPGAELIGAFTDKDATFGAKGSAVGGGVGAGLGAAIAGPVGAQVGKMLGSTVGQLIGGAKDKKLATQRMSSTMERKYGQLNLAYNANPYGTGSTFYAEDGLVLPGVGDTVSVNIEKGELLIDPSKMEVIQSFDSKRYKTHAKDKSQEHPGNFIEMDASHVIIPKKKAKAFKEGDRISRRSIIAQIMENQDENGIETNDEVLYAQNGVVPSAYRKIQVPKYQKSKNSTKKSTSVVSPQSTKIAGQIAPTPSFTDMQEFSDYTPAAQLLASRAGNTDFASGLDPMFDASANLEQITSNMNTQPVSSEKPAPNVYAGAVSGNSADIKMDPSLVKKPTFLQKLGLADLQPVDINPVKAARAMNFLPTTLGLIQAGQSDPFLQYDENNQFDSAKAMVGQIPVDESIEAARAGIAQNTAGFVKAMRNVNSPSGRAEVADVILKSNAQVGQIEQDAQNRRTQRIGQKLGLLADIEQKQGADRLQARNKFALESSQDRAVRQGLIQSAVSEGATNYAKSVMDDEKVKAVNAALKYNKIKPGSATSIEENQDAINNAILTLSSVLPNFVTSGAKGLTTIESQKKDKIGAPAGSTKTTVIRR